MFTGTVTIALLAFGYCQAAEHWIRGGNTCIGVDTAKPRSTMYGPCDSGSKASPYIEQTLIGGAVVSTATDYWTPANVATKFEAFDMPMTNGKPTKYATRASTKLKGQSGCEFAAAQASAEVTTGGNTGIFQYAAVINTGTVDCMANSTQVVIPQANGCDGDACQKTGDICIKGTGATCEMKTFTPGSLKFSAGLALKNGFSKTTITNGGATVAYFGYRLAYNVSNIGAKITDVYYNGNTAVTTDNLGSTDVTKFAVKKDDKSVVITTGGKYTWGTWSATTNAFTYAGSTAIVVRSAAVPNTDDSIYVDFLFEAAHLGGDKWVLYDPEVTSTGGASAAGGAHVFASAASVAIMALIAGVFQLF